MTNWEHITPHYRCRACSGPLQEVLNLGTLRLNAFPASPEEAAKTPQVDLVLSVCTQCGLAQLKHTTPPDWLYRKYWYRSGVNEMMVHELRDVVAEAVRETHPGPHDHVLDIGANDGTLLEQYQHLLGGDCPIRVAVEPALNLQPRLRQHAEIVVTDYFPSPDLTWTQTFPIITAIAMCYDLEDPVGFFTALRQRLMRAGLAIVQFQDLGQMMDTVAFDNICHEHLEYYTLHALLPIVQRAGLVVTRCLPTPINGGSLRVCLRHQYGGFGIHASVGDQLAREQEQYLGTQTLQGRGDFRAFESFAGRIRSMVRQIRTMVAINQDQGAVTDIYGASTKGNILLQVLGVGPDQIRQAIDRSEDKVGAYTITGIPIVSETEAKKEPADIWLCPIWQFRASVLLRERWYLEQGGRIIFPLPYCEVVAKTWRASA